MVGYRGSCFPKKQIEPFTIATKSIWVYFPIMDQSLNVHVAILLPLSDSGEEGTLLFCGDEE